MRLFFPHPAAARTWHVLAGLAFCAVAGALHSATAPGAAATPTKIPLWPGPAPTGDGAVEPTDASLTVHRPDPQKAKGAAIVICPGGGYGSLVVGPEGHGIAQWLNQHGITGIVLEYRLPAAGRWCRCSTLSEPSARCGPGRRNGASIPTASASSASRRADIWPPRQAPTSTAAIRRRPIRSIA